MEERVNVNLLELGSKAQSKYEIYKILTVEGNLYLPPYKECSIQFITDILHERKRVRTSLLACFLLTFCVGLRELTSYCEASPAPRRA
jgi:hypothetical protein